MTTYQLTDVFVTGGEPTVTYVGRREQGLEEEIQRYLETGGQALAISGPSKSGKSTLVNRLLRDTATPFVRVTGSSLESMSDFWQIVAHRLAVPSRVEYSVEHSAEVGAKVGGKVGGGVVPAEVSTEFESRLASSNATLSSPTIVLSESVKDALIEMNIVLVLDDFHYAPEPVRQRLARELKDLIFKGARVILVAIPQRVMDVLQSEAELAGRVRRMSVPDWTENELLGIATLGFDALNVHDATKGGLVGELVPQSYGSPLLMQALCRKLCEVNSIPETVPGGADLVAPNWEQFYGELAMSMQPRLVEHLNMGPVERRRRTQRPVLGGGEVDLYSAVLMALRLRSPQRRMTPVELSDSMTEFMVSRPQLEHVRRTCRQMADIAMRNRGDGDVALDYSTTPERLSIVDPYLAFFLTWGLSSLGLPSLVRR